MKKLLIGLLMALGMGGAHAQFENQVFLMQRNAADTGNLMRFLGIPASGANALILWNGSTLLPQYVGIGSGLSVTGGALTATATTGPAGPQGPQGVPGNDGAAGAKGDKGDPGATGATGAKGDKGDTGSTGAQGNQGVAGVQGPAGPQGATGATGSVGATGPAGTPGVTAIGYPTSRTFALATAYQCTNPLLPCVATITITSTANLSLSGGTTNTADILIGNTSSVASGTGTIVAKYLNSLTGALTITLAATTGSNNTYTLTIPTGGYFAVRQTAGTVSIVSGFDQSVN